MERMTIGQDVKITLITGIVIEGKIIENSFDSTLPGGPLEESYTLQTSPGVKIKVGNDMITGFEIKKREEVIYVD